MAAKNGHVVDEEAVNGRSRDVAQSNGMLFGKCQWNAQLQSMGQREDAAKK